MKEVEVKFQVKNIKEAQSIFEKAGTSFKESVQQDDIWFTDPETAKNFDTFASGKNFVRIRTEGTLKTLTLKIPQKNEMDCIEFNTQISDTEQTKQILLALNLVEVVKISKKRSLGKDGEISVCLDEVENLGQFIELEKITPLESESKLVQQELRDYIKEKEIPFEKEISHGYDTLKYLFENKS